MKRPPCLTPPLRALIAGGGAPEIELAVRLAEYSRTLGGMEAYCVRAYSDALEVIPSTLAENAGLNPISTVTELRNRHAQGDKMAGINVRKVSAAALRGQVGDMTSAALSSLPPPPAGRHLQHHGGAGGPALTGVHQRAHPGHRDGPQHPEDRRRGERHGPSSVCLCLCLCLCFSRLLASTEPVLTGSSAHSPVDLFLWQVNAR